MSKFNFKILIQKRFLLYSLMLHAGVGVSFAALNSNNEKDENKENNIKIIEIDVSAPKQEESMMAETFSEDDIQDELEDIIRFNENVTIESKLRNAELKEKKKAAEARKRHEEKERKIKEKKRIQREKQEAEKKKRLALEAKKKKELEAKKLKEEKERAEKEKRIQAQKKKERERIAKEKAEKARKQKEAEQRKIANSKPKKLSKNKWLETSDGQSAYFQYGNSVMSKIQGRWIRPAEALSGWYCDLEITQTNKGRISSVRKVKCDPNNQKFYNSVYKAIMESSPLPLPTDDRLFDKKIKITFKVE